MQTTREAIATVVAAALAALLHLHSALADEHAQRETFLDAEAALRLGDRDAFNRHLRALEDYPLYPYLLREDLRARLGDGARLQIEAFLEHYDGEPFVTLLRRGWLENRAAERHWDTYLQFYRPGLGPKFDCWQAEASYRTGSQAPGLQRALQLWDHGRSRPKACDSIFAILVETGSISTDLAWSRIEQAMRFGELGLARYLRRFVPEIERPTVDQWINAHEHPATVLSVAGNLPQGPRADKIVLHALRRWARYDSPAAGRALDRLEGRFQLSGPELNELQRYIALSLAQRGDQDALRRLNAIPAELQTKDTREWRARTFLRNADWQGLADAIEAMPPEQTDSLRWRYWLGRALAETGHEDRAESLFQNIARERDYHGFLAAERLGQPYQFRHQALEVDPPTLASVASDRAVARAHELLSLGRPAVARSEWRHALEDASVDELRAAAALASSWGWHSVAIATVARAGDWDDLDLRFPIVHRPDIVTAANSDGLEPEWIYGIARQESMFREDAKSSAGALGLMQLLPTTARLVASQVNLTLKNSAKLLDPQVNIRLGSHYLRLNRDRFQGSELVATAAYNAGPQRVVKWLPAKTPIAADVWVETIPFTETRRYVQRVMEYSAVYGKRLGSESDFFARQTAPVAPSDGGEQ